ncbi:carbohydrate esterase family 16 protein [Amanita muscaria Koide BX008]|uniref:Carbohydrate esterase family 16 protein n=1 Tax=Amanita muscaria (strain Koide BX008) TaxID=946122 RepID=A0A0C2XJY9_AMAMK|nr:carbohydrate esterase family 16 protein [Amanita muscaria Koide BX008]
MSTVIQLGSHWPTFAGIKYLVIFGDSYSSVYYDLAQTNVPDALQPLGVTYPGITWNEVDKPNWVGHLIAEDCPGHRYRPFHDETGQDLQYMSSPLLVYDYARGGDTIAGVQHQIRTAFLPKVGQKPSWAPWSAKTSLFVTWVGINDCALSTNHSSAMDKLLKLHEELYEAGARNFMFVDVPPINRSPAYPVAFSDTDRYIKWNLSLKETIKTFGSGHDDVTILLYSSFALFTTLLDNPDGYGFPPSDVRKGGGSIWFDHLHPTSRVHKFLSQDIGEFLSSVGKELEVPN